MNIKLCIDELLMSGADDWVLAAEVAWVAESTGGAKTPDQIRDLSLRLIRELLQQGMMEIGDLSEEAPHFRKWNLPMEEALERVEREWKALGRLPDLGDICWLQNTVKGNKLGKQLLKQRESSS